MIRAAAALLRFLQSVRLAVVLIILILSLSLLSTFVPQNLEASYYRQRFPAAADLLLAVGFTRFFSSPLFLVPAAAFAVNLAACAVGRIVRRSRAHAARRRGPDLIHIGLLALMAGGLLTASLRTESLVVLSEGEEAVISGVTLRLDSFEYTTYDNGAPRSWVSTVSVMAKDGTARPSARIRVNAPLRLSGVTVYQASFAAEGTISLRDSQGGSFRMKTDEAFREGDTVWYAAGVEKGTGGWAALFIKVEGDRETGRLKAAAGERVGGCTVERIDGRLQSGLKAVSDPGYYAVLPAFLLIVAGLLLTFIQKRKDQA